MMGLLRSLNALEVCDFHHFTSGIGIDVSNRPCHSEKQSHPWDLARAFRYPWLVLFQALSFQPQPCLLFHPLMNLDFDPTPKLVIELPAATGSRVVQRVSST